MEKSRQGSENKDADIQRAVWVGVIGVPLITFTVSLVTTLMRVWETWVAMTIWGWFAPWPLPFGLVAGTGLNIAVSLVFRGMPRMKDERTSGEKVRDSVLFLLVSPLIALCTAAGLLLFL